MNKSSQILTTQSSALLLHIGLNHLLTNIYQLELVGCSIATFFTFCFIYLVNRWKLHSQNDMQEVMCVKLLDQRVRSNIWDYLSIGLPGVFTLVIEFVSYEITVIYLGQIGIEYQAAQTLLLNIFSLPLMLAFGYQQASCALIGQQIGINNVLQAKAIWRKLLGLFILSDLLLWNILFWNRHSIV